MGMWAYGICGIGLRLTLGQIDADLEEEQEDLEDGIIKLIDGKNLSYQFLDVDNHHVLISPRIVYTCNESKDFDYPLTITEDEKAELEAVAKTMGVEPIIRLWVAGYIG